MWFFEVGPYPKPLRPRCLVSDVITRQSVAALLRDKPDLTNAATIAEYFLPVPDRRHIRRVEQCLKQGKKSA